MDKKYQVFVSSTYSDLIEERQSVFRTLMEMDCIPAGMELFPAADEEQFEFIKSIINDCDYYILIIGGRYGSTTSEGLSYTEKEYDYARSIGLRVLSFIHERPGEIALNRSEIDPSLRARLAAFREKVKSSSIVKMWAESKDLAGLVSISLSRTIKTHPAVGWVRANQIANSEALTDLNQLRKRNQELEEQMLETAPSVEDIAGLEDVQEISGIHSPGGYKKEWKISVTWGELFAAIAPYVLEHPNEQVMHLHFKEAMHELYRIKLGYDSSSWSVREQDYHTAKVHLMALNLVNVQMQQTMQGGMALFWNLTPRGRTALLQLRSIKKQLNTKTQKG